MEFSLKEFSVISVVLINSFLTIRSFILIKQRKIQPALAMWLFFTIAVALSLITFKSSGDLRFIDNILNTTDLVYVLTVTIAIWIYGDISTKFDKFDLICLGAVFIIFIFWILTQNHFISNLLVQFILVIAYFPTIKRFIKTKKNTESFTIWILMLVVSSISLLSTSGLLATVYSLRAVISIGLLLLFMTYLELSQKEIQNS